MDTRLIGTFYSNANRFTLLKKNAHWNCGNPVIAKMPEFGGQGWKQNQNQRLI